jgi:hypothetical protein
MNRLSIRCTACLWAIYAALFAQDKTTQDQDWALFRKAYPYHGQAVALSEEYPGRSRTLIVSEPPPTSPSRACARSARKCFRTRW